MTDDVWKRDEVESPCVRICLIHPEVRLCIGCHRSAEEIAAWGRMTPGERRAIMADLASRAPRLAGSRRGRAVRRAARRAQGTG
ncbi:MAG: DUF1289 domain-containing protein [Paracoccaceae bacterium]